MWLRLAAKDNLEFYQKTLLAAEEQMTADQIAKGKALAAAWKPTHGLRLGRNRRRTTSGNRRETAVLKPARQADRRNGLQPNLTRVMVPCSQLPNSDVS
jgi:hypothetical protein